MVLNRLFFNDGQQNVLMKKPIGPFIQNDPAAGTIAGPYTNGTCSNGGLAVSISGKNDGNCSHELVSLRKHGHDIQRPEREQTDRQLLAKRNPPVLDNELPASPGSGER